MRNLLPKEDAEAYHVHLPGFDNGGAEETKYVDDGQGAALENIYANVRKQRPGSAAVRVSTDQLR